MMKTKLQLFVTVLAVALFGVGCASVPKPDVANAVKWNGHWYAVLPEPCNRETAIKKCEQLGGHLAFVETEAENKFVAGLLVDKTAWIGGYRKKAPPSHGGGWFWLNGKPIAQPLWAGGPFPPQPDSRPGEDFLCIQASQAGGWGDVGAKYKLVVVCEWE